MLGGRLRPAARARAVQCGEFQRRATCSAIAKCRAAASGRPRKALSSPGVWATGCMASAVDAAPASIPATGVRSVTSASAAARSPTAMTAMAWNVAKTEWEEIRPQGDRGGFGVAAAGLAGPAGRGQRHRPGARGQGAGHLMQRASERFGRGRLPLAELDGQPRQPVKAVGVQRPVAPHLHGGLRVVTAGLLETAFGVRQHGVGAELNGLRFGHPVLIRQALTGFQPTLQFLGLPEDGRRGPGDVLGVPLVLRQAVLVPDLAEFGRQDGAALRLPLVVRDRGPGGQGQRQQVRVAQPPGDGLCLGGRPGGSRVVVAGEFGDQGGQQPTSGRLVQVIAFQLPFQSGHGMLVDHTVRPRLPRGRFGPGGEGGGHEITATRRRRRIRGPPAGGARRRDPARPDLRPQQAAEEVGLLLGPLALRARDTGTGVERLSQQ